MRIFRLGLLSGLFLTATCSFFTFSALATGEETNPPQAEEENPAKFENEPATFIELQDAQEAADEEAMGDVEEELVPIPEKPGYYRNPAGEIVDDFGIIMRLYESPNACARCHYSKEQYEKLVLRWDQSKHSKNKVTCIKCHGGNDKASTIAEAKSAKTTDFRLTKPSLLTLHGEELFAKAFDYCGQCHGTIYRDWKAGIHGKRTGSWNGDKEYWVCIKCHNPHNPKIRQIKPKPAPRRPAQLASKGK